MNVHMHACSCTYCALLSGALHLDIPPRFFYTFVRNTNYVLLEEITRQKVKNKLVAKKKRRIIG